jgi:hypothetical protein
MDQRLPRRKATMIARGAESHTGGRIATESESGEAAAVILLEKAMNSADVNIWGIHCGRTGDADSFCSSKKTASRSVGRRWVILALLPQTWKRVCAR